jgi:hypothetical protein
MTYEPHKFRWMLTGESWAQCRPGNITCLKRDHRVTADEVARCWAPGARGPSSFNGFDAPDRVPGVVGDE